MNSEMNTVQNYEGSRDIGDNHAKRKSVVQEANIPNNSTSISAGLQRLEVQNASSDLEKEDKSSYEIAAEALCLMKSGGLASVGKDRYMHENTSELDSAVRANMCRNTILKPGSAVSVQLENGVHMEVIDVPDESAAPSVTNQQSNKQPTRYVLVPEIALLNTDKSGNLLPIQGTPYFIVMTTTSNVVTIPASSLVGNHSSYPSASQETVLPLMSCPVASEEVEVADSSADDTVSAKKNLSRKNDALKFPPCVICLGEASGMHYGCNTCEACKNFFRRCLLRKSSPFVCHGGNECTISHLKNKNNCSACRLAKCLALGMAKEKCKMGRYTALMRTETIKKVRKLEGKDDDDEDIVVVENPGPSSTADVAEHSAQSEQHATATKTKNIDDRDIYGALISKQIFCSEDEVDTSSSIKEFSEEVVQTLVTAMNHIKPWGEELDNEESRQALVKSHFEKYQAKVSTFGALSAVSMTEYWTLLRKYGIDIDNQWAMFKAWTKDWEFIIARYCKFAKQIPYFQSLSYDDQACLLKSTHFGFFLILMHKGYYPEYNTFIELNGTPFHIEEASDKIFSRCLVEAMVDMFGRLQKLQLSSTEMALLMAIVTMSPDQCKVDNQDIVEEAQLQLTNLLLKDMGRMYGHTAGMKKFTCIIDTLTKMRDVANIYYKEYKALCSDSLVRETVPNVDCVLPEDD